MCLNSLRSEFPGVTFRYCTATNQVSAIVAAFAVPIVIGVLTS